MFGGNNDQEAYDEVWILSLPDFVWTQAPIDKTDTDRRRTEMSCVLAGRRQMIVVGGLSARPDKAAYSHKDPFPQGLGIFDLTKLEWKDTFDPGAEPYDSPDVIKSLYDSCCSPIDQKDLLTEVGTLRIPSTVRVLKSFWICHPAPTAPTFPTCLPAPTFPTTLVTTH